VGSLLHDSSVGGLLGEPSPLWRVLSTIAPPLPSVKTSGTRKARWLLRHHPDVMLLADRGNANHELMKWLRHSPWHYAVRLL